MLLIQGAWDGAWEWAFLTSYSQVYRFCCSGKTCRETLTKGPHCIRGAGVQTSRAAHTQNALFDSFMSVTPPTIRLKQQEPPGALCRHLQHCIIIKEISSTKLRALWPSGPWPTKSSLAIQCLWHRKPSITRDWYEKRYRALWLLQADGRCCVFSERGLQSGSIFM